VIRGTHHSSGARAKMSAAMRGRKASPETRAKISAASKRAWADPAVRAKISAAMRGRKVSPAVRAKMSAARRVLHATKPAKRVPWTRRRCEGCGGITAHEHCEHCGRRWERAS
jgi:hypothetical protein